MELHHLTALVAVAEHRTFSAAARALHTVQSNVSTHVARLERELDVVLVDRSAQRLTAAGELVVARARRVQAELDALASDVASITSQVVGRVQFGSIGTTGRWLVPILLDRMAEVHPKVEVIVNESVTTTLLPQLLTGQIDLAVVNLPLRDPEVEVRPLFEEDLLVIAPTGHALAEVDTPITFAELAPHEFLLGPQGTSLRDDIDRAAAADGVRLLTRAELDGVRLTASMAFQGYAPTIVPATAVPTWIDRPTWTSRRITGSPRRQVGLATPRRGLLSRPAEATRDLLVDVVEGAAGVVDGIAVPS